MTIINIIHEFFEICAEICVNVKIPLSLSALLVYTHTQTICYIIECSNTTECRSTVDSG